MKQYNINLIIFSCLLLLLSTIIILEYGQGKENDKLWRYAGKNENTLIPKESSVVIDMIHIGYFQTCIKEENYTYVLHNTAFLENCCAGDVCIDIGLQPKTNTGIASISIGDYGLVDVEKCINSVTYLNATRCLQYAFVKGG